jgi:hypothetical protein
MRPIVKQRGWSELQSLQCARPWITSPVDRSLRPHLSSIQTRATIEQLAPASATASAPSIQPERHVAAAVKMSPRELHIAQAPGLAVAVFGHAIIAIALLE